MAKNGKVICVSSAKGGVGKTIFSLNLAGVFETLNKKVLLIDLDLAGGGIALALGREFKKDIYNIYEDLNNNKFNDINNYITKYDNYIDFIATSKDPRNLKKVDGTYLKYIYDLCRYYYDIIIIDTNHFLTDANLITMDLADEIFFMMTNDPLDVKNMKSLLNIFKELDKDNFKIILNDAIDHCKNYFSNFDLRNIINANIDYTLSPASYVKNIDTLILNGKIITLQKNFQSSRDYGIYLKIATNIFEKGENNMNNKSLAEIFDVKNNNNYINTTDYNAFKDKKLLNEIRVNIIKSISLFNDEINQDLINEIIEKELNKYDLTNLERSYVYNLIDNEVNGSGPISELLKDNAITEIMVNGPSEIYIETNGEIVKDESVSFIDDNHIIRTVNKLIEDTNITLDLEHPIVDARTKDGSHINAIISPISVSGPVFTIKKINKNILNINDLIRLGTLTPEMARFLEKCVKSKLNIIICGNSGAGKNTLLNVLCNFIDINERIVTIEDNAFLNLSQKNVISLEENNISKKYSNTNLISLAKKLKPNRVIIGGVTKENTFDVLHLMNSGFNGTMTSLHVAQIKDIIKTLSTNVLFNGKDIPINLIKEYICEGIDLIIFVEKLKNGQRKITSISEIIKKEDNYQIAEIFGFKKSSNESLEEFITHKRIPDILKKLN